MQLRTVFSTSNRDELVREAAALLENSYAFIVEQKLEQQLHGIAMGHMMRLAERDKLVEKGASDEIDALFSLMALRALDEFSLQSQSVALTRTMRGEIRAGPQVHPELAPLLEKRAKAIKEAEAIQKKIVLAAAAKKKHGVLTNQRKKKEKEIHSLALEISKAAGLSDVSRAF